MDNSNGSGGDNRWERPDAPLGTLIYRAGLLSKEKLEFALQESVRSGRRLGEVLLQKGWIDEKDLARLLAGQKGLAFVSLRGRGVDRDVARLLSEQAARYHHALPFEVNGEEVLVAVADPTDERTMDAIGAELGRDFKLAVATATEIRNALDEVYAENPTPAVPSVGPPPAEALTGESPLRVVEPATQAPVEPPAPAPVPVPVAVTAPVAETNAEPPPVQPAAASPEATPAPPEATPAPPEATPAPPEATPAPPEASTPLAFSPADASPPEPMIERDPVAHVSVAFNPPAPPAPPAAPGPVSPAPAAPAPASPPTPPVAAPPSSPEPAPSPAVPQADETPAPSGARFRLLLEVEGSEDVELGLFDRVELAEAAARDLMARVQNGGDWPRVGQRFIRPERIISVQINER